MKRQQPAEKRGDGGGGRKLLNGAHVKFKRNRPGIDEGKNRKAITRKGNNQKRSKGMGDNNKIGKEKKNNRAELGKGGFLFRVTDEVESRARPI